MICKLNFELIMGFGHAGPVLVSGFVKGVAAFVVVRLNDTHSIL